MIFLRLGSGEWTQSVLSSEWNVFANSGKNCFDYGLCIYGAWEKKATFSFKSIIISTYTSDATESWTLIILIWTLSYDLNLKLKLSKLTDYVLLEIIFMRYWIMSNQKITHTFLLNGPLWLPSWYILSSVCLHLYSPRPAVSVLYLSLCELMRAHACVCV